MAQDGKDNPDPNPDNYQVGVGSSDSSLENVVFPDVQDAGPVLQAPHSISGQVGFLVCKSFGMLVLLGNCGLSQFSQEHCADNEQYQCKGAFF